MILELEKQLVRAKRMQEVHLTEKLWQQVDGKLERQLGIVQLFLQAPKQVCQQVQSATYLSPAQVNTAI